MPSFSPVLRCQRLPVSADEALLDAAQRNDLPGVLRALEQEANINARARYERTAFLFAARNANLNMVKLLVERGADVTIEDTFYGRTALTSAITNGNVELALYLIENGTPAGSDALAFAVEKKDLPLLRAALARGNIANSILAANHAFQVKTGNNRDRNGPSGGDGLSPGCCEFDRDASSWRTTRFHRYVSTGQ